MEDIELLLDRFWDFKNSGQNKYFDSDDIISLIDYFTETDDIENLQSAIDLGYELHPGNMDFKIQICRTLISLGDFETALKMFEEIDIEDDKEIDLLYIECLCELGLKEEATEFINGLADEGNPYLEEAIEHAACVFNDNDENIYFAHQFISDYLQIYPDNKTLKTELCFNLELQGRIKEAMMKCEELLQSNLYSAELWFMKGRLHATYCDFEKAVDALDYALSCINSENEDMKYEILILKANCFLKNENYYSAIGVCEELMTMKNIDKKEVISNFSECLIMIEDYEQAYRIMKDHLTDKNFFDSISIVGNFIFCCVMTDRRYEAAEMVFDAIKASPHDRLIGYMTTINALQSELNNMEKDTDEEHQQLVSSFINSNLHVN
jgi:tetratricopeptide (TPR) repeat protein